MTEVSFGGGRAILSGVKHRLALCAALAAPILAFACSSEDPAPAAEDAGTLDGATPTPDASRPDTSSGGPDATADAGDGGGGGADGGDAGPTCLGNPLPDAGADAGIALRTVTTGQFLDGPQWIAGEGLAFSELFLHRILLLRADGGTTPLRDLGATPLPIGSAYDARSGALVTAQANPGALLRTRPDGGALAALPIGAAEAPNDVAIARSGALYFTDPAYQSPAPARTGIYRSLPDGGVAAVQTFASLERANGIALSPDERSLYVSFTDTRRVARYPLNAQGEPGAGVTILTGQELRHAPDGLAVDVGGNLYIAEAHADGATQVGAIEVFRPSGQKWGEIPVPGARPTGVAFGGPSGRTLFVTTETSLLAVDLACAGPP